MIDKYQHKRYNFHECKFHKCSALPLGTDVMLQGDSQRDIRVALWELGGA